jgi:prolyl 4-hydroxylase
MNTKIKSYKNFITPEECENVINIAKPILTNTTVIGSEYDEGGKKYRVADGVFIYPGQYELIDNIKKRIAELSKYPIENQEAFHVICYPPGGYYVAHHDFFHPANNDLYMNEIKKGGQRTETWLLYLNDYFEGGETRFPREHEVVVPETGMIVNWNNILETGALNYDSLHSGEPIISGQKWVATIWVRESTHTY